MTDWPTPQTILTLLVGGALAATLLKIGWGVLQWRQKSEHRVGGQMHHVRAEVVEWDDAAGYVRAGGEIWRATSSNTLAIGDCVRVAKVDGLTLTVRKI